MEWKEGGWVVVCRCARSQCSVMEQRNDGDEMDGGDETGCSRH